MNQDDNVKYKWYLHDLGPLIKERAPEAKVMREQYAQTSPDYLFQSGRVLAFNEVFSILQQQADGFMIERKELDLGDIEPDRDLV